MLFVFYSGAPKTSTEFFYAKLLEEVKEVEKELEFDDCISIENRALEILDVMQICYTYLIQNYEPDHLSTLNSKHVTKLRNRYSKRED